MTPDFFLAVGDLLPVFTFEATYADGTPVNLTGCTVTFRMFKSGSSTAKIDNASRVTITSPASGLGYYTWATGDTDTAGDYLVRLKVVTAGGLPIHVPNTGFSNVQISDDYEAAAI